METVYLVDGSGYIFRAFYAVTALTNSKGFPTNALLGFTRMLQKLIRDVQAKHIAVCFDTKEPTFRHEQYVEYKAHRKECPEDLVPQLPYFRQVVAALGIPAFEKAGFEADDIIATVAMNLAQKGLNVVIVSGDKDLTQLVNGGIKVWDAMRDVHFTEKVVEEKFGVAPEQIVDFLALTGDSSDNIPGAKGIGPKTAQILLKHFGSVENLLHNLQQVENIAELRGAKGIQKKLESSVQAIELSKKLVTLDINVEPFTELRPEELLLGEVEKELAVSLFEELEFTSILKALVGAADLSTTDRQDQSRYELVTPKTFPDFMKKFSSVQAFAFDTETSSLDPFSCGLVGISISWEKDRAYFLPFLGKGDPELFLDPGEVREFLAPIFRNKEIKKSGANLKFDLEVLHANGYEVQGLSFDVMLASYVINPDKRQHGLKSLAKTHLDLVMTEFKELVGDCDSMLELEVEKISDYACHDADVTWQLEEKLGAMLGGKNQKQPSLGWVFEQIEMPLIPVLAKMEEVGIALDLSYLERLSSDFSLDLKQLEERIYKLAGGEFNLNSPKQLSEILYERLSLSAAGIKKTQSFYSTDASMLKKLSGQHPIVDEILEYRELFKLKSTYVDALVRLCNPKTGRIHTSYNQAVAATGRLSSSDPNLQNIPIRTARGRLIRNAFVARPGYLLLSVDYSQIELRVLAELTGDANLKKAFLAGEDIHTVTATELFGDMGASEEERGRLRRIAKTINFGIIYGMSAFRLAQDLGISRKQAQQYIDNYFMRYPNVRKYFDDLFVKAKESGYVETYFGRRRYLSDIDSSGRDEGYVMRSVGNAPLQGTAADVIKLAMIHLGQKLSGEKLNSEKLNSIAEMVLQVHDELVIEVKEEESERIKNLVVDTMESAVEFDVPLKVDVSLGRTWGDAP